MDSRKSGGRKIGSGTGNPHSEDGEEEEEDVMMRGDEEEMDGEVISVEDGDVDAILRSSSSIPLSSNPNRRQVHHATSIARFDVSSRSHSRSHSSSSSSGSSSGGSVFRDGELNSIVGADADMMDGAAGDGRLKIVLASYSRENGEGSSGTNTRDSSPSLTPMSQMHPELSITANTTTLAPGAGAAIGSH